MAEPDILVCDDIDAIARRGAIEFVRAATDSIKETGLFRVALSGGATPLAMYRLLSTYAFKEKLDWTRVRIFFGDERCVRPDDEESNFKAASDALLNEVARPVGNIHRIRAEFGPGAAAEYTEELAGEFDLAGGELPDFDLMLLGMGADGHTASIFAGSPAMDEKEKLVMAVKPPPPLSTRITLTPPVINNSKRIIFLVSGESKAAALKSVLGDGPEELPARITRSAKGTVKWIVDKAAAKEYLSKE